MIAQSSEKAAHKGPSSREERETAMIRDEDVHFHAADPGESTWAETNFFGFYNAEAQPQRRRLRAVPNQPRHRQFDHLHEFRLRARALGG